MAQGGTIRFDVEVNGYWQVCPVCTGCGTVAQDFYACLGYAVGAGSREQCRRCDGTGTIEVPLKRRAA